MVRSRRWGCGRLLLTVLLVVLGILAVALGIEWSWRDRTEWEIAKAGSPAKIGQPASEVVPQILAAPGLTRYRRCRFEGSPNFSLPPSVTHQFFYGSRDFDRAYILQVETQQRGGPNEPYIVTQVTSARDDSVKGLLRRCPDADPGAAL